MRKYILAYICSGICCCCITFDWIGTFFYEKWAVIVKLSISIADMKLKKTKERRQDGREIRRKMPLEPVGVVVGASCRLVLVFTGTQLQLPYIGRPLPLVSYRSMFTTAKRLAKVTWTEFCRCVSPYRISDGRIFWRDIHISNGRFAVLVRWYTKIFR